MLGGALIVPIGEIIEADRSTSQGVAELPKPANTESLLELIGLRERSLQRFLRQRRLTILTCAAMCYLTEIKRLHGFTRR